MKPLGHAELVRFVQSPLTPLEIQVRNVSVTPDSLEDDRLRIATFPLTVAPIYGLVDGGWLPMPWAHKPVALLDSNIVIAVEKMTADTSIQNAALQHFLGLDAQLFSPLLYALEGVFSRPITEIEFNNELTRGEEALKRIIPVEKIQILNAEQKSAMYDILRHQSRDAAIKLVTKAAPLVADQLSAHKRPQVEAQILNLAAEYNVPVNRFIVLALLSCVHDSLKSNPHRAKTPGRSVIKPKITYDEKAAYAAVSDLYMLEFLHNIQAISPEHPTVFYTQDLGLASIWTAMQPCQRKVVQHLNGQTHTTITFPLDRGLFPALSPDETTQLKQRLLNLEH